MHKDLMEDGNQDRKSTINLNIQEKLCHDFSRQKGVSSLELYCTGIHQYVSQPSAFIRVSIILIDKREIR